MSEYISREEALMAVTRAKLPDTTPDGVPIANGKRSVTDCVRRIKDIPAADVRPVVRGKWEEVEVIWLADIEDQLDAIASMFCPKCKRFANHVYQYGDPTDCMNFCPNCGAMMEES